MSDMAERGVVFVLRAQTDETARAAIEQFGRLVQAQQGAIDKLAETSAKKRTEIEEVANERIVEAATIRNKEIATVEQAAIDILEKRREKVFNDRVEREKKKLDEAAAHEASVRREMEKLALDVADSLARADDSKLERQQAAFEAIADAHDAALERMQAAEASYNKTVEDERLRSIDTQVNAIKKLEDANAKANEAGSKGGGFLDHLGKLEKTLDRAFDATTNLVRGFALLGMVGETDVQKLTDGILRVQGAIDVARGAKDAVVGVAEAWGTVGETLQSVAALYELLGTKMAQVGATKGLEFLKNATSFLPKSLPAAGLAAGTAIVAGAAYTGNAAGNTIGGMMNQDDPLDAFHYLVRDGFGAATLGLTTRTGFFGKTSTERRQEAEDQSFAKRSNDLVLNNVQREKDEKRAAELAEERLAIARQEAEIQRQVMSWREETMTVDEKRAVIVQETIRAEQAAQRGVAGAAQEAMAWYQRRGQLEKQINADARSAAEQNLAAAQRTLDIAKQRLETEKASLMSAKERFGMLSNEDQQAMIQRAQMLRTQAGGLTAEDLSSLRGVSDQIDQQIKNEALRRADAAGFDKLVGFDSNKRIRALESEIKNRLEVDVKAKAEVVAKLDADAKQIGESVRQAIAQQWQGVLDKVAEDLRQKDVAIAELRASVNKRAHMLRGN